MFILGLITGLLIALMVFICEILLFKREKSITKYIEHKVIKPPTGAIIMPNSDEEDARQGLIRKNTEQGRPTYLKDL